MNNNRDMQHFIILKCKELSGIDNCGPESEIFYDLHISGDDFVELIEYVYSISLNPDFSLQVSDFVPQEGFNPILALLLFLGRRPFRPLTIGQLADFASNPSNCLCS